MEMQTYVKERGLVESNSLLNVEEGVDKKEPNYRADPSFVLWNLAVCHEKR